MHLLLLLMVLVVFEVEAKLPNLQSHTHMHYVLHLMCTPVAARILFWSGKSDICKKAMQFAVFPSILTVG